MSISVTVKSAKVTSAISKKNKPYYTQQVWAWEVNDDLTRKEYPSEVKLFLQTDENGNPISYPVAEYKMSPASIRVQNNNLVISYPKLIPLEATKKSS